MRSPAFPIPLTLPFILWAAFAAPSIAAPHEAIDLVGVNVTPHQYSSQLRWRRPPNPELSARVELFVHNPTDQTLSMDAPWRFDDKTPEELVNEQQWSWQNTAAATRLELPAGALRVVRWNGFSAAWGTGTQHQWTFGDSPSQAIPFEIAESKMWIESIVFAKSETTPYPNRMLATVRNDSGQAYRVQSCRMWLPKSNDSYESLFAGPERTMLNPYPESGVIESGEMGGIELEYDPLPLTYAAVEITLASARDAAPVKLWSYLKIRPAAFDISGGWIANDIRGKSSLLHEPFLKTLARMHINTGQIEEVRGYTDNPEAYNHFPIKRFNRLADRNRYDHDSVLPTIHAVEFLGEPQYGGGRPVPPQDVFDQLSPYHPWKLPTTLTLSEERTWRYYSGLSDYPHYDAYRVIAPAADAWSNYDRWQGKSIRWGAPLETIGDMTRSLREQSRPATIAYWSQGAHDGWGGILSPRRGSPTPDELRSQAWHGLGNGIASLYWFNLSVKSVAKYPDLIDPIARVGREIQLLRPTLEFGTSYEYRRIESEGQLEWDLSSIAARDSLLMVANDLGYSIDDKTRTFRFDRRPGSFQFRLPRWLDEELHVFRVDADGTQDVRSQRLGFAMEIQDDVHVVGIYVATRDPELRGRVDAMHRELTEADLALDFDPGNRSDDLNLLRRLVD
jgi:hypothetical protein